MPTYLQILSSDNLQARRIVARLCPGVHIDDLTIALVFEHEAIDILCNGLQKQKEQNIMHARLDEPIIAGGRLNMHVRHRKVFFSKWQGNEASAEALQCPGLPVGTPSSSSKSYSPNRLHKAAK